MDKPKRIVAIDGREAYLAYSYSVSISEEMGKLDLFAGQITEEGNSLVPLRCESAEKEVIHKSIV